MWCCVCLSLSEWRSSEQQLVWGACGCCAVHLSGGIPVCSPSSPLPQETPTGGRTHITHKTTFKVSTAHLCSSEILYI